MSLAFKKERFPIQGAVEIIPISGQSPQEIFPWAVSEENVSIAIFSMLIIATEINDCIFQRNHFNSTLLHFISLLKQNCAIVSILLWAFKRKISSCLPWRHEAMKQHVMSGLCRTERIRLKQMGNNSTALEQFYCHQHLIFLIQSFLILWQYRFLLFFF